MNIYNVIMGNGVGGEGEIVGRPRETFSIIKREIKNAFKTICVFYFLMTLTKLYYIVPQGTRRPSSQCLDTYSVAVRLYFFFSLRTKFFKKCNLYIIMSLIYFFHRISFFMFVNTFYIIIVRTMHLYDFSSFRV